MDISLIPTSIILRLIPASTIFRSYSYFKFILGLIPTSIILGLIPASTIFRSYSYFNIRPYSYLKLGLIPHPRCKYLEY